MMITPPAYTQSSHQIAILQQLQRLSDQPRTVTLADIAAELETLAQEFGAQTSLEDIIQRQAGAQLAAQCLARRREVAA